MNNNGIYNQSFRKIPLDYLWDGLTLSDAVYNSDGTAMLIPADEPITKKMLSHLSGFLDEEQCITVSDTSYEIILREKPHYFSKLQYQLETRIGYTDLKHSVDEMLQISRDMAQVEPLATNRITEHVFDKLNGQDADAIFQCIDVPRPMDEALQRHSLNVAILNGIMGQWLSLSDAEIHQLIMSGLLHDIGKTKIPPDILNAPRKLTPAEFSVIKNHPLYSHELLGASIDAPVRLAVLQHHEKLDGSGYPDGLLGDDISLFARITAVSDIYDALISARSYKKSRVPFDVLEEFASDSLHGIDPYLLKLFVKQMIKYYKTQQVILSDGSRGQVAYIPPNDISHPVIVQNGQAKQVNDDWYCVRIV